MGRIHSIETMGALDGPGLRMVVFLQGCPMRCKYCHNPDTWSATGGEPMSAQQLVQKALRYKRFFGKRGGVTFSGGEPLMQADFVSECTRLLHENGVSVALDTSGCIFDETVASLLDQVDLVLLDIKHSDKRQFADLTGVGMDALENVLAHLRQSRKPVWVRQVIVEGYTQSEAQVRALKCKIAGINAVKIELLPYHTLGVHKWAAMGLPYGLTGVQPPDGKTMNALQEIVE